MGVYPQVSLKEARTKRESAKKLLGQNIDPSQSKQLARIMHECCRALACSFARNESLLKRP